MINPAIEEDLKRMSLNDVNYADYIKENYVPIEVLQEIRQEIDNDTPKIIVKELALAIIDKHIKEYTNEECD